MKSEQFTGLFMIITLGFGVWNIAKPSWYVSVIVLVFAFLMASYAFSSGREDGIKKARYNGV